PDVKVGGFWSVGALRSGSWSMEAVIVLNSVPSSGPFNLNALRILYISMHLWFLVRERNDKYEFVPFDSHFLLQPLCLPCTFPSF
ncbi:hypothetical protein J0674_24395, partial [Vibrio parahaemolyticus]|uniref:hypothetical protein n=1 Tax=Vibrio parahaemolyticus TaxID=670 RepID=UPI001A8C9EB4